MDFVNFTDIKGIPQDFSDCGLHNDEYTKYSPHKKCVNRALMLKYEWTENLLDVLMQDANACDDGFIDNPIHKI